MADIITLYDIPSTNPSKAWSPNLWKARFALNIKGLPYRTVWVEYPDIEPLCKKIGAAKTNSAAAAYTLPVIHDPAHNAVVSDSIEIARYLDKTYPDTTPLFPCGSQALQAAFQSAHQSAVVQATYLLMIPPSCAKLNPASEPFFRRAREANFGMKMEEFSPLGPTRDLQWKTLSAGHQAIASWLAQNEQGPFVMGAQISYADATIAAYLIWMRTVFGSESAEWKDVLTWQDGRWAAYMEEFKRFEQVIE
ncbi:hypothetical protein FIBSPDRAFT_871674 [Athelia psychrophila]|uniref:GST N-terminal domain-containing protein n=1 Tax=Athelia psychrophila TaxID=1759441 RepID=A0A166A9T1_9AGAM|nr:hypothetical protein FIBSPDRAFT_871674 [Fibularhizoctonia sp. CBS 109695]